MLENLVCPDDLFDAIYLCSCEKPLCPKHYFSHQEKFSDHKIDRIKIPVNNESRHILISFVITFKKNLISIFNKESILLCDDDSQNDKIILAAFWIKCLDSLLLFLAKVKHILLKVFYSPFEYFLYQPAEKASRFVNDFVFPKNFTSFNGPYKNDFFYFNYFIYKDKRYIFGWEYCEAYNEKNLQRICIFIFTDYCITSEYEMAYEILQNLIRMRELAGLGGSYFSNFSKIIYDFIKKWNYSEFIQRWKQIEENIPSNDAEFYILSNFLFSGLQDKELMSYCHKKHMLILKSDHKLGIEDLTLSKNWHYCFNENKKGFVKYCIKIIRLAKNSSNIKHIAFAIESCSQLGKYYIGCKKQRKIEKIVKIVNEIIKPFRNTHELDEVFIHFYHDIGDFDKACKMAWKLINLHKQKKINLYFNIAHWYSVLGNAYDKLKDYKKAIQAFCNAKSLSGILPFSDSSLFLIYYGLANTYLKIGDYKYALYHYNCIIDYCRDENEMIRIKNGVGIAHLGMKNYDKALECFIEIEKSSAYLYLDETELFSLYEYIGFIYHFQKNDKRANTFYSKAYKLINNLEIHKLSGKGDFINMLLYFLDKCDYEKYEEILKIQINGLKGDHSLEYKSSLFIMGIIVWKKQNKMEKVNEYLDKLEKLLDLKKISFMPKKKIDISLINNYIVLAKILFYHKNDLFKAEKICKAVESALDTNLHIHACYFNWIYDLVTEIYLEQDKRIELKESCQKYKNLLKLAHQNELYRLNMNVSQADVEEGIRELCIMEESFD